MADKRNIQVGVETDATKSVQSINEAAAAITRLVSDVKGLESALSATFSGKIPAQAKELAGLIDRISTNSNKTANQRQLNNANRQLAGGGVQTQLTSSIQRGVIANLRTDPAYMALQFEKEATKVAEARVLLYRRMRDALPSDATQAKLTTTWQNLLKSMGGVPEVNTAGRKAWAAKTRAEAINLEKQISADTLAEINRRMAAEQDLYAKYARRAAPKIAAISDPGERQTASTKVISNLQGFAQRRASPGFKLDTSALTASLDLNVERLVALRVDKTAENLKRQLAITKGEAVDLTEIERLKQAIAAEQEIKNKNKLNTKRAEAAQTNITRLERQLAVLRGNVDLTEEEVLRKAIAAEVEIRSQNKASTAKHKQAQENIIRLQRQLGILSGEITADKFTEAETLQKAIATQRAIANDIKSTTRKSKTANENITRLERELAIASGQIAAADLTREESLRRQLADKKKQTQAANAPTQDQKIARRVQDAGDFMSFNGGSAVMGMQAQYMANSTALQTVLGALKAAGTQTIAYQAQMKDLQAITGATDQELTKLSESIVRIGANSKFSLNDLAEGSKVLAQAGYSAAQVDASIQPIMNYAAATGSDLRGAVETTTSVLSQFKLSMERTGQVTNVMTAGLNKSKLNAEQLALSIQYAGNQAALSGMSFEEMVAALGAMSNAGIRSGSTLGTGLRAVLAEFEHPTQKFIDNLTGIGLTAEDVSLKTHSLTEVMTTLLDAGFTYSDALGSFDKRASAAFFAIQNNLPFMKTMQQEITGTQAASEAAGTQMETFAAQSMRLQNALGGIVSNAGTPLLMLFQGLAGGLADVVSAATPLAPVITLGVTAFGALTTVSTLRWLLTLSGGIFTTTNVLKFMGVEVVKTAAGVNVLAASSSVATVGIRALTAAILTSPLGLLTIGITAAVGAFAAFNYVQESSNRKIDEFKTKATDAAAEASKYEQRMAELDKTIDMVSNRYGSLASNQDLAGNAANTAIAKFSDWGLELRGRLGDVNNLITGLVKLRAEMAAKRVAEIKIQNEQLTNENKLLGSQNSSLGGKNKVSSDAASLLKMTPNLKKTDPELHSALIKLANKSGVGNVSELDSARQVLNSRIENKKLPAQAGRERYYLNLQSNLNKDFQTSIKIAENNNTIANNKEALLPSLIESRASGVTGAANIAQGQLNQEQAAISKEKDPVKRRQAQIALNNKRKAEAARIAAMTPTLVKNLEGDIDSGQDFKNAVTMSGMSADQYVQNSLKTSTPYNQLMAAGGDYSAVSSVPVLQQQKKNNRAKYNQKLISKEEFSANQKAIDDRLIEIENPNLNPEERQNLSDERATGTDLTKPTGGGGGGGQSKKARQDSRTAASRVKSLTTQIERTAASMGPTGEHMLMNEGLLTDLLRQWKEAREAQVRADASGADQSDLQARLADLEVESKAFSEKIMNGNVSAARKLMADVAEREATNTQATARIKILNGGPLEEGLSAIEKSIGVAVKAKVEASVAAAEAASAGSSQSATALADVQNIVRDGQTRIIEASLELINDFYAQAELAISRKYDALNFESEQNQVLNSGYSSKEGMRTRSDLQRRLATRRDDEENINQARLKVSESQAKYDNNQNKIKSTTAELDNAQNTGASATEVEKISTKLKAAQDATAGLAQNLTSAQNNLKAMTGDVPAFATGMEAVKAAFGDFARDTFTAKPLFEQIGDSTSTFLTKSKDGLGTYFAAINDGTKDSKKAFVDMRTSILATLRSLAAQIIADQLIKYVLSLFGMQMGTTNGQTSFSKIPAKAKAQGGVIRKAQGGRIPMAGGGAVPNRDSVNVFAEPGEYMLRKSAVDMVGVDTLDSINAMGNKRMSNMPTIQSAIPQREPDTANVYIMAPNSKPTLGKKDVIAYILEDAMSNGQTKKLIKSIAMGNT